MDTSTAFAIAAASGLTLLSGVGDSYGFIHASKVWDDGRLVGEEVWRSAMGFSVGITTYWLVVRYLNQLGIESVALQTIGWFGVTLIGVSLTTGEFSRWTTPTQLVAVGVVVGIGWLMVTTEA